MLLVALAHRMSVVTPKRSTRLLAVTAAACVVTMLVLPLPVAARTSEELHTQTRGGLRHERQ